MKPTQEQLNDPVWWDEHSHDQEFIFFNSSIGEYQFANRYGRQYHGGGLLVGDEAWELLAKRPTKPAFVPEVGIECEFMDGDKWSKCKIDYISDDYIVVFMSDFNNYEALSKDYYEFRPIKSERELFNDAVSEALERGNIQDGLGNVMYDSGLFCLKEADK